MITARSRCFRVWAGSMNPDRGTPSLTVADPCIWHGYGTNLSRWQSAATGCARAESGARVSLQSHPPQPCCQFRRQLNANDGQHALTVPQRSEGGPLADLRRSGLNAGPQSFGTRSERRNELRMYFSATATMVEEEKVVAPEGDGRQGVAGLVKSTLEGRVRHAD